MHDDARLTLLNETHKVAIDITARGGFKEKGLVGH